METGNSPSNAYTTSDNSTSSLASTRRVIPSSANLPSGGPTTRVLDKLDVTGPLVGFEVNLNALPLPRAKPSKTKPALNTSDLPPVERDFAFVVDLDVTADALIRAARSAEKKLIINVSLFDVFEDKTIGEGKKSLAVAVTLQPRDKTMTDAEIDAVSLKIVTAVEKATGGTLRA